MNQRDEVRKAVEDQKRRAVSLTEEDTALIQWANQQESNARERIAAFINDARKVLN
jgi:selenocysteine lyase/cysteine desulfurase